ncbi:M48 family metallopeptidase [Pseudomonas sp. ANT_J28]|uniref:tetratricopeptide repeat protein n=1 Tax=Pseudomonas sp. ANT_J28 TaxID=2597352 RepID=UPI0021139820|nr:tetratricopeptide repeat protein [Pseudomonas sp. ANT_J28]
MPSHIDVLCGDYRGAMVTNSRAILADSKYLEQEGPLNFYTLYRCHNYHFKLYSAMFLGQYQPALEAADQLMSTIREELLRVEQPPMADWLEGFVSMKVHVQIRFGKWQDILATPLPNDQALYCVTTAMLHYARGVAHAATGYIAAAEAEQRLLLEAWTRVPDTRYLFNNKCTDILAVAAGMLSGEIEYRKGNYDDAFAHLRQALSLDDNLPYDEPWGWMQPVRHALGALLLEQGRVEEALQAYRADLGLDNTLSRASWHLDNVWSLHGYAECLRRLDWMPKLRNRPAPLRLVNSIQHRAQERAFIIQDNSSLGSLRHQSDAFLVPLAFFAIVNVMAPCKDACRHLRHPPAIAAYPTGCARNGFERLRGHLRPARLSSLTASHLVADRRGNPLKSSPFGSACRR